MAEVKPASSRQQTNTEILMDCQTELKLLIKKALFDVVTMAKFEQLKNKLIEDAIEQLDNEAIKETSRKALQSFAKKEYELMVKTLKLGTLPLIVAFAGLDMAKVNIKTVQKEINAKLTQIPKGDLNKGFSQLGNSQAKVSFSQSLYGHSELNTRYKEQVDMVDKLREETRLVVCSTHSDCSDRCFKWQGRVYSLDGTSGITDDGRRYEPLEVATNAVYKGHKNGLITGYNCRHKLMPYKKGLKPIKVTRAEQQREKKISEKQRWYEREIRKAKDLALTWKHLGVAFKDKELEQKYNHYKERATELTNEYKEFCQTNNRVEYRSRLKI